MRISSGIAADANVTDREARLVGVIRSEWHRRVRASQGFYGLTDNGPSVGNYTHVQLLNPAASGITVLVYRISLARPTGVGFINVRRDDVARATLSANTGNLVLGAAAPLGQLRFENNAVQQGVIIGIIDAAATLEPVFPDWCFELGAGEGITFEPAATNVEIGALLLWVEF